MPYSIFVGFVSLLVLLFFIPFLVYKLAPTFKYNLRDKRICLLIAHPDDEAMFFAPTLQKLTEPELKNQVKLLCLSTGDSEGLGETRKRELVKSASKLGLPNEEQISVVDNSLDFPDSMSIFWDRSKIADLLFSLYAPKIRPLIEEEEIERRKFVPGEIYPDDTYQPEIDVLITFDSQGISSHPNHISLYHGAKYFISQLSDPTVRLYTLSSISIFRKYASFLDIVITSLSASAFTCTMRKIHHSYPPCLSFLSSLKQIRNAQLAMITCHHSQMRWFRWGWIICSRYMLINDLRLEEVNNSG